MSLPTPNTRKEQYLNAIATGNAGGLPTPITREEEYLEAIAKSGGGSGEGDMKKSVYDSDLAVSNAGGIGAFVSDAISGKVDKVEGKGLSENDYSDTEKGKVTANAEAIEAMVNVLGAKNLFDISNPVFISDLSVSGNVLTNSETDTKNIFSFNLRDNNNNIYVYEDISQDGHYEYPITVSSAITYLIFKHNGASRDLRIDVKPVPQGDWIISFDVDGYNPSVVGGLEITEIMLRPAGTDPTYEPYAMTNRELTDAVNRGSVSVTADGVKTYSQLFDELFALTDTSKISRFSRLAFSDSYFRLEVVTSSDFFFTRSFAFISQVYFGTVDFKTSGSTYVGWEITTSGNSITNYTDTVLSNGDVITLYY